MVPGRLAARDDRLSVAVQVRTDRPVPRIGYLTEHFGSLPEIDELFQASTDLIRQVPDLIRQVPDLTG